MPTIEILSPLGHVAPAPLPLARRPARLEGLRPGILENQKQNARLLMESMVAALRARLPLGDLVVCSKTTATAPRANVIARLTAEADFLLTGTSD